MSKFTNLTLFRKKEIFLPTLYGWLLIGSGLGFIFFLFLQSAQSFLAYHHPIADGQAMIVEGWLPDYALETTYEEFQKGDYQYILTTGGPLERGSFLSEFKSYASLSAMTLKQIGVNASQVIPLPTPHVQKNRTKATTLAVKKWLANHPDVKRLNLVTLGPHARRSFYTFRKSLPPHLKLGVISITSQDYSPDRWWLTSAGIRTVLYEGMALIYVYFF